jgi:hypothetical protein
MLDAVTRGLLDKTIDEAKGAVPVALMTVTETTKEMHIQNVEDYVLGAANGFIIGKFFGVFSMLYQRYPDEQEMKEMREVINNRSAELREASIQSWMSKR